jgi:uracil phosphoribosyltransferase
LQQWGVADIRMLAVITAPEGIERLQQDCPDVRLFCCACDRELNDQKFILPGLGDAGDRIFGT